MIHYVRTDLFFAPASQLLTHSVNCKGIWASGIAKQFRDKYATEYYLYKYACNNFAGILGQSLILNNTACLFTSIDYGINVDLPEEILAATQSALEDLLSKTTMDIAMPKINSGLFKVPWEQTAEIIELVSCGRDIFVYTNE